MAINGDKLMRNVLDKNYVDLKDQLENELAKKITKKIKDKKSEIMKTLTKTD